MLCIYIQCLFHRSLDLFVRPCVQPSVQHFVCSSINSHVLYILGCLLELRRLLILSSIVKLFAENKSDYSLLSHFFSEFNFLLADWVIYILRSCVIFEYQKIIVKERKAHKSSNGYRMLMLQSRGRYSNLNSISEFPRQQTGYLD